MRITTVIAVAAAASAISGVAAVGVANYSATAADQHYARGAVLFASDAAQATDAVTRLESDLAAACHTVDWACTVESVRREPHGQLVVTVESGLPDRVPAFTHADLAAEIQRVAPVGTARVLVVDAQGAIIGTSGAA